MTKHCDYPALLPGGLLFQLQQAAPAAPALGDTSTTRHSTSGKMAGRKEGRKEGRKDGRKDVLKELKDTFRKNVN